MSLGQIYNLGTVTVTNGSATVTSAGAIFVDVIIGDTLQVGATQAYISSVNAGFNQLTLMAPWAGATVTNSVYMILKNSWQRYDPAITQVVLRDFLSQMAEAGTIYTFSGSVPDPAIGKDGDYALNTTTPSWTLWLKVTGTWVAQGDIREPFDTRHNICINGGSRVWQMGVPAAAPNNGTAVFPVDMWDLQVSQIANTANISSAQGGCGLSGINTSIYMYANTGMATIANTDYALLRHKTEGYRIEHFGWGLGAGAGKPIMVAFWNYSLKPGVAFVKLSNHDRSRCYYHEITVGPFWGYFSFAVPPEDTIGAWNITNGVGLRIEFFAAGKEASPASVLNAWGSTNKVQTTNSVNLIPAAADFFYITSLFISAGTQLPAYYELPNLMRPYDEELLLCQRYLRYETYGPSGLWLHPIETNVYRRATYHFNPYMRIAPTMTITAATSATFNAGYPTTNHITPYSCELLGDLTSTAGFVWLTSLKAEARLPNA
jgi:hypothetical protein